MRTPTQTRSSGNVKVADEVLADFCRRHNVRRLAFFGSILRADFHADSDIDVLVEFEPGRTPGFLALAEMQGELSAILGGREVDLRTPQDLSPYFRDEVIASSQVRYVQG
ncbi:MAG: uncharacterized protein QOE33_3139 [Acidobacteriota bacterium]|nr:uncharacterized protein [Acidobacteriota bacterium]